MIPLRRAIDCHWLKLITSTPCIVESPAGRHPETNNTNQRSHQFQLRVFPAQLSITCQKNLFRNRFFWPRMSTTTWNAPKWLQKPAIPQARNHQKQSKDSQAKPTRPKKHKKWSTRSLMTIMLRILHRYSLQIKKKNTIRFDRSSSNSRKDSKKLIFLKFARIWIRAPSRLSKEKRRILK